MLGLTDQELKQSRFYQEVFAEGAQEGEIKGWQKGKQEGEQEGEIAIILRLLQRRFGPLPPDISMQISHLSLTQLEAFGEALLEFASLSDAGQWLQQVK